MSFHSCYNRRGNITIVVLLLMIASGLLALLTLQFVKHFLTNSSSLDYYYKAYYMARGGIETMLTQANLRGYGFEYDLLQTPSVAANYYNNCSESGLCQLQGTTVTRGQSINNTLDSLINVSCAPEAMITLQPGASSAFPLFYDNGAGDGVTFTPVADSDYAANTSNGFDVRLSGGSLEAYLYDAGQGSFGQITANDQISAPSAASLFNTKPIVHTHRLILSNPGTSNSAVSYCLKSDDAAQKLVGNFTNITSQATYNNKTVGLTAVKKFVFPSVFIQ